MSQNKYDEVYSGVMRDCLIALERAIQEKASHFEFHGTHKSNYANVVYDIVIDFPTSE